MSKRWGKKQHKKAGIRDEPDYVLDLVPPGYIYNLCPKCGMPIPPSEVGFCGACGWMREDKKKRPDKAQK